MEKYIAQLLEEFGFVTRYPQKFWCGETREDNIARLSAEHGLVIKLFGLGMTARDGVWLSAGILFTLGAIWLASPLIF